MLSFSKWMQKFWYNSEQFSNLQPLKLIGFPLHLIFKTLVSCRRNFYQYGLFRSSKIDAAVIIVGNITVGGTGKSPLVIHLANEMTKLGYRVGILSRGYGAKTTNFPHNVEFTSVASEVGDEPAMLRGRIECPIVIDPNRLRGANHLVNQFQCTLILCDDGLQHYALRRDIELVVVDGERVFGNQMMLPVGPLREPIKRINSVDAVVLNEPKTNRSIDSQELHINQFSMSLQSTQFCRVNEPNVQLSIEDFIQYLCDDSAFAVAGIGNPQRFFEQLTELGIHYQSKGFSDHHQFTVDDFKSMTGTIIMTEKDAVKCNTFVSDDVWFLRVDVKIEPSLSEFCHNRLKEHQS